MIPTLLSARIGCEPDALNPDALLSDLMDVATLEGLRDDIERHALHRIIKDEEFAGWQTVGDVLGLGRVAA